MDKETDSILLVNDDWPEDDSGGVQEYGLAGCGTARPEDLDRLPHHTMEIKFDGARYALYVREAYPPMLLSRRTSVKGGHIDKIDRFPALGELRGFVDGVFDGEVVVEGDKSSETTKLMGSSPERAQRMIAEGKIQPVYVVFDVLELYGEDLRSQPFESRRQVLESLDFGPNTPVKLAEQFRPSRDMLEQLWAKGKEGVVVKDTTAPYGSGWAKIKRVRTYDVVVTGMTQGGGKYKGMLGAVKFSVHDGDKLVEIGQASGMDDGTRLWMTENFGTLKGQVIEVMAQEFTGRRLRHPRFVRLRPDKNAAECTLIAVKAVG